MRNRILSQLLLIADYKDAKGPIQMYQMITYAANIPHLGQH